MEGAPPPTNTRWPARGADSAPTNYSALNACVARLRVMRCIRPPEVVMNTNDSAVCESPGINSSLTTDRQY